MNTSWEIKEYDENTARDIAKALGISMITARLLVQRGVSTTEEARFFLFGDLSDLVNPLALSGMLAACDRIEKAIQSREPVVVYGDYDVDGICAAVLLTDFLKKLGCQVDYYIPDRFNEGYGLNKDAISNLSDAGFKLLISVDCGISSLEEVDLANCLGMEVIITDHHTPPLIQPRALAIINPKNDACESLKDLAGAGVAFKLICALGQGRISEEKLWNYLDLVALATVSDIVNLQGENRILVKYGLPRLGKTQRPGLRALMREVDLKDKELCSWHLAFLLAPRLNSAGRLGSARDSANLLITRDPVEAQDKAKFLCRLNDQRRDIENDILQAAIARVQSEPGLLEEKILVVDGPDWHKGVIGIVASRLSETYKRPCMVISWEGDHGRGSARSWGDFNLYEALKFCSDCLLQFGGHPMAAGLTIKRDQLAAFRERLHEYSQEQFISGPAPYQADLEIEERDIGPKLWSEIKLLSPFGEGNPAPVFIIRACHINQPFLVGNNGEHAKFKVGAVPLEAIAFNRAELIQYPLESCTQDIIFELDENQFRGRRNLQLRIKDLKCSYISDNAATTLEPLQILPYIRRAAEEVQKDHPVLFVYPTFRSVQKHRQVMKYFFKPGSLLEMHGHLGFAERVRNQELFKQGAGKVFLSTCAFMKYYYSHWELSAKLHYILRLWPRVDRGSAPLANCEVATVPRADGLLLYRSNSLPVQGRAVVYANTKRTVDSLNKESALLQVEAGIVDPLDRRELRRRFNMEAAAILVSDGTHVFGRPGLAKVQEIVLADSPFGHYELEAFTDGFKENHEIRVGISFEREALERNWRYLERLYPDPGILGDVANSLAAKGLIRGKMNDLTKYLSDDLRRPVSSLETLASLRLLEDLDLCKVKKSGSIIEIKFIKTNNWHINLNNSPYYWEGQEEKEVFNAWCMELDKFSLW